MTNDIIGVVTKLRAVLPSKNYAVIESAEELDGVRNKGKELDFVWIKCNRVKDPVHMFWLLHDWKKLTHGCRVVFTETDSTDSGWGDLTKSFGGLMWGPVYLLVYSINARPGVLPSQRGMYLK